MGARVIVLVFLVCSLSLLVYTQRVQGDSFDNVGYGVKVDLSQGTEWGTTFDSISYGVNVNLSTGGGSSDYSDWWEFYKLDNRYDVNADSYVNTGDTGVAWIHRGESYDYLYDVNPSCGGDGYVNTGDTGAIWINRGV